MNNQKPKTLVSTIANVVSTIVLIFSIVVCTLVIASMKSSSGVANIFGYSVLSVQSDSMEPVFNEGDLIVIRCTKTTQRFKKGDIVSFIAYDASGTRFVNTHRIVNVVKGETRDRYTTKGDNAPNEDIKKLYSSNIVGIYADKKVSGLGKVVDFFNSPFGVLLSVVIPSAIIIIAQAVSYVHGQQARKKEMMLEAEERARQDRIDLVNEVVNAQRNAGIGAAGYVAATAPVTPLPDTVDVDDPEKQRIIEEFLAKQRLEEAKKQAIIEEYLQKQKEQEQAEKAEVEAAKIKAIIAEFLAQQKAAETDETPEVSSDENQG